MVQDLVVVSCILSTSLCCNIMYLFVCFSVTTADQLQCEIVSSVPSDDLIRLAIVKIRLEDPVISELVKNMRITFSRYIRY